MDGKFTWKAEDITLLDKDGNEIEPGGKEHAQQQPEAPGQKAPAQTTAQSTESRSLDERDGEREIYPKG